MPPGIVFYRFQFVWDIGYWLFAECAPTRRATQALLTRNSAPALLRLIADVDPDVIVCTYPNVTEVLGRLRRAGRLNIPVCAAITDLAALDYWASPGIDVHLVTHPESIPEVRRIAGAATEIHCVHGFSRPEFRTPQRRRRAPAARSLCPNVDRSCSSRAAAGESATWRERCELPSTWSA